LGALLECLFSDGLVAQELLPAGEIGFGKRQVGARQLEIGTRLIESDLEGPAIDGEEEVSQSGRPESGCG
jgi:hypothetical protein